MNSLVSKLVNKFLGDYVEGLDSNNLNVGLMSGEVTLENLTLKKDQGDKLKLPMNVAYSTIGKIWAKIPWRSLSSQRCDVKISDIFVILEPKSQEDLNKLGVDGFQVRQMMIEAIEKDIEEKVKKGKEEKKEEEDVGYIGGMIKKITANFQVEITNIHVRIECKIKQNPTFGFGMTLDSLTLFTVDIDGKPIFVDPTQAENKGKPLFKQLKLKNFAAYWNTFTDTYIARLDKNNYKDEKLLLKEENQLTLKKLRNTILNDENSQNGNLGTFQYLVDISLEMNVTTYERTQKLINEGTEENCVKINVNSLNVNLTKQQFTQIMKLTNHMKSYLSLATVEKNRYKYKFLRPKERLVYFRGEEESRSELIAKWFYYFAKVKTIKEMDKLGKRHVYDFMKETKPEFEEYKQFFLKEFEKSKEEKWKTWNEERLDLYELSIMSFTEDQQTKIVIDYSTDKWQKWKVEEAQNAKKGYFGGWFGGTKDDGKLTEKEAAEIEGQINDIKSDAEQQFTEDADYQHLKIYFQMKSGTFSLMKKEEDHDAVRKINIQEEFGEERSKSDNSHEHDMLCVKKKTLKREPNTTFDKADEIKLNITEFNISVMLRNSGMDMKLWINNFDIDYIISCKKQLGQKNPVDHKETLTIFRQREKDASVNPQQKMAGLFGQKHKPSHYIDINLTQNKPVKGDDKLIHIDLQLKVKKSEICYNERSIGCVLDIFDMNVVDGELKKAAKDTTSEYYDNSSERLGKMLKERQEMRLDIQIDAPMIVIPLNQLEQYPSECFVFNPGIQNVSVNTREKIDIDDDEEDPMYYDHFKIELQNTFFCYFASYLEYQNTYSLESFDKDEMAKKMWQNKSQLEEAGTLVIKKKEDILKPFKIDVYLDVMKPKIKDIREEDNDLALLPLTVVEVTASGVTASGVTDALSAVSLRLDPVIYKHLLNIGYLFDFEIDESEQLVTDKQMILADLKLEATCEKSGGRTRTYKKVYVIYTGARFYFFNNEIENSPYDFFSLHDMNVAVAKQQEALKLYAIRIFNPKDKSKVLFLSFDDAATRDNWLKVIKKDIFDTSQTIHRAETLKQGEMMMKEEQDKIDELGRLKNDREQEALAEHQKEKIKSNNPNLKLRVGLRKLNFDYDGEKGDRIFSFALKGIYSKIKQFELEKRIKVRLTNIQITDHKMNDPLLKYIITTKRKNSVSQFLDLVISDKANSENINMMRIKKSGLKQFLELDMIMLDKENEKFIKDDKKIEMSVDIVLEDFFLHLRPNSIQRQMLLFMPHEEQDDENNDKMSQSRSVISGIIPLKFPTDTMRTNKNTEKKIQVDNESSDEDEIFSNLYTNKKKEREQLEKEIEEANQVVVISHDVKKTINMQLNLEFTQVSCTMINEINNIYQTHLSITELNLGVLQKVNCMTILFTLNDFKMHDLTNYPHVLIKNDLKAIDVNKIFSLNKKIDSMENPLFSSQVKDLQEFNEDDRKESKKHRCTVEENEELAISNIENVAQKMAGDYKAQKLHERIDLYINDASYLPDTDPKFIEEDKKWQDAFLFKRDENKKLCSQLITLKVDMFNPDVHPIPEDMHNMEITLDIGNILVNFYMQQLMRFIHYVTGHILPSVIPDSGNEVNIPKTLNEQAAEMAKGTAIGNQKKPYWMKMDILIDKPEVNIKPSPHSLHFLQASLETISVKSNSCISKGRVSKDFDEGRCEELKIDKPTGIWYDQYDVNISNVNLKEIRQKNDVEFFIYIIENFDINIAVQMVKFSVEYRRLFGAINDPIKAHEIYNLREKKLYTNDNEAFAKAFLAYDAGMYVGINFSPMVICFGQHEYNFLMKALNYNIAYDDKREELFNLEKNQQDQQKQSKETIAAQDEDKSGMYVRVDMSNIALIAFDDKTHVRKFINIHKKSRNIPERRVAYTILEIKESTAKILMHSDGDMNITYNIGKLEADYLKMNKGEKSNEFVPFGFINNILIKEFFNVKANNQLRKKLIKQLQKAKDDDKKQSILTGASIKDYLFDQIQETLEQIQDNNVVCVKIDMGKDQMNIQVAILKLRIMAQTDAQQRLSRIATTDDDVSPPEPEELDHKLKSKIAENSNMLSSAIQSGNQQVSKFVINRLVSKEGSMRSSRLVNIGQSLRKMNQIPKIEKKPNMNITLYMSRVTFIIPTKLREQCLVTSGDIIMWLSMFDSFKVKDVARYQKNTMDKFDKKKEDCDYEILKKEAEAYNKTMDVNVRLLDFQIFLCEFREQLIKSWNRVKKRHLLMPTHLDISVCQFYPSYFDKIYIKNVFKSKMTINIEADKLNLKATVNDIDNLMQIKDYQFELMASADIEAGKEKAATKKQQPKNPEINIKHTPMMESKINIKHEPMMQSKIKPNFNEAKGSLATNMDIIGESEEENLDANRESIGESIFDRTQDIIFGQTQELRFDQTQIWDQTQSIKLGGSLADSYNPNVETEINNKNVDLIDLDDTYVKPIEVDEHYMSESKEPNQNLTVPGLEIKQVISSELQPDEEGRVGNVIYHESLNQIEIDAINDSDVDSCFGVNEGMYETKFEHKKRRLNVKDAKKKKQKEKIDNITKSNEIMLTGTDEEKVSQTIETNALNKKKANEMLENNPDDIFEIETLDIEKITIQLINDAGKVLTPIMEIMIGFEKKMFDYLTVGIASKIKLNLSLGIDYFNPKANKWEPILEHSIINLKKGNGIRLIANEEVKFDYMDIQIGDEYNMEAKKDPTEDIMNINISTKAVEVLMEVQSILGERAIENEIKLKKMAISKSFYQTLYQFQKEGKMKMSAGLEEGDYKTIFNIGKELSKEQADALQNVEDTSPYVLQNYTGYEIELQQYKRVMKSHNNSNENQAGFIQENKGGAFTLKKKQNKCSGNEKTVLSQTVQYIGNCAQINLKTDDLEQQDDLYKRENTFGQDKTKTLISMGTNVSDIEGEEVFYSGEQNNKLGGNMNTDTDGAERYLEDEFTSCIYKKQNKRTTLKVEDVRHALYSLQRLIVGVPTKTKEKLLFRRQMTLRKTLKTKDDLRNSRIEETANVTAKQKDNMAPKILMTIKHPKMKIDKIDGLNLDNDYSKRIRLRGFSNIASEFSLVCTSQLGQDFKNVLVISSPLLVSNKTSERITLKIQTPAPANKKVSIFNLNKDTEKQINLDLTAGSTKPIPFDLINCCVQFSIHGATYETEKIPLYKFSAKTMDDNPIPLKLFSADDNRSEINIILKVSRDKNAPQRVELVLLPMITVKNCLPYPMKYRLSSARTKGEDILLLPREEKEAYCFNYGSEIDIEVLQPGFVWSDKNRLNYNAEDEEQDQNDQEDSMEYKQKEELEIKQVDCKDKNQTSSVKLRQTMFLKSKSLDDTNSLEINKKIKSLYNFVIYAEAVIINESNLGQQYFEWNEGELACGCPLAGQNQQPVCAGEQRHSRKITIIKSQDEDVTAKMHPDFISSQYKGYDQLKPTERVKPRKTEAYNEFSIRMNRETANPIEIAKYYDGALSSKRGKKDVDAEAPEFEHMEFELIIRENAINVDENFADATTLVYLISPKNIFYNDTEEKLQIRQYHTNQIPVDIPKKSRTEFWWKNGALDFKKGLEFQIIKENQHHERTESWSGGINLKLPGTTSIMYKDRNEQNKRKYFEYDIKNSDGLQYIFLKKQLKSKPLFKVKNHCNNFIISCYQQECKQTQLHVLNPHRGCNFSWTDPMKDQKIIFDFKEKGNNEQFIKSEEYDPNEFSSIKEQQVRNFKIHISCNLEGAVRSIQVEQHSIESNRESNCLTVITKLDEGKDIIENKMTINISNLGISWVGSCEKRRIEALYILLRGITFQQSDDGDATDTQLRIKTLQIDNNTSLVTPYMVVMTPTKPKDVQEEAAVNIILRQRLSSTDYISIYDKISFELKPLTICIDEAMVADILITISDLQTALKTGFNYLYEHKYFYIMKKSRAELENFVVSVENMYNYLDNEYDWVKRDLPQRSTLISITTLLISAIHINLSFKKSSTSKSLVAHGESTNMGLIQGLASFGISLINLDTAPLRISGFKLNQVFETYDEFNDQVKKHYKSTALEQILRLAGSLDLIGSPSNLLNEIGSGAFDLFDAPAQGFSKGPLEGVKGIGKGIWSLLKGVIAGVFNSLAVFFGVIASSISSLTMDKPYIDRRGKRVVKKAKNCWQGLWMSLWEFSMGIFEALYGFFENPVRLILEVGLMGLLYGLLTGLIGIIAKPVVGFIGMFSKLCEGIKNGAQYFDDKPITDRSRPPRVFYSLDNYFKSYNLLESKQLEQLMDQKNGVFSEDHYVDTISFYDPHSKKPRTILATNETFLILDQKLNKDHTLNYKNIKIIRQFAVEDLKKIALIHSKDGPERLNETSFIFEEQDNTLNKKLIPQNNNNLSNSIIKEQQSDSYYDTIEITLIENYEEMKIYIHCDEKDKIQRMYKVLNQLRLDYITKSILG